MKNSFWNQEKYDKILYFLLFPHRYCRQNNYSYTVQLLSILPAKFTWVTLLPNTTSRLNQFHLNKLPNPAGISPFRSSQKMNCTLQTLFYHESLPSQHETCFCCLQSGGESCPVRAKTRRSDCRSPVCSHSSRGKNLLHRYISFETPSILHRLLSDHRRLQILLNHQDRFCIHHWSCRLTCKLRRSSYKQLKEKREKVKPNEHQVN